MPKPRKASCNCCRAHSYLRAPIELHAAGKTRVIRENRELAQVNEAMDDVLAGRVDARIVFPIAYSPVVAAEAEAMVTA